MKLELRPHQSEGFDALRAGFAAGKRTQIFYLPTGGGKTETAIALMSAAAEKGRRAAMVMDRIVLCDQTSKRLDKYGISHGVMQASHWRYRPHERIQVCSAQTLERRDSLPNIDLLIVDECHNSREQLTEFIRARGDVKVVGLTATPFTKGLGRTYSQVVSTATTDELVCNGNLVPLRVFQAKQIDMDGAKKVAGEWSSDDVTERGVKLTGDIVSEWINKTYQVFGGPKKTIVFCAGVDHGADLARKFNECGHMFMSVSYRDTDETKRRLFEEFAKPDSNIRGLIATDILTKGFDVPDVMIGVSARPFSKSFSSHVQQLGRVMRPCEGKEFALWLDHSGNYLRFQDDWEDVYYNGVHGLDDSKEKPHAERTEKEKQKATCPRCGAIFPMRHDFCLSCGYQRLRHNGVIVLPGELEEIKRREAIANDDRALFWSELHSIVEARGYKPGWAYFKFREKYGCEPRGLKLASNVTPRHETMKWVAAQARAYSRTQKQAA